MCLVVLVLSMLVFVWLRSLPGGPVSAILGERQTPERRAALEAALGLDQPLPVQYLQVPRACGRRATSASPPRCCPARTRSQVFLDRLPATDRAVVPRHAARDRARHPARLHRRPPPRARSLDTGAVIFSLVGVAVPVFFTAFLLKYFFAVEWNLLPVSGRQTTGLDATRVTGMFVLDGILTREWDAAWDALKHLILPGRGAGDHPVRGDLPDHPGLGPRRARRGLRPHRRGEGPHRPGHPRAATCCATRCSPSSPPSASRSAACSPARCSPSRSSPSAGSATRSPPPSARRTTPCSRC